jgi:hypothetical protein
MSPAIAIASAATNMGLLGRSAGECVFLATAISVVRQCPQGRRPSAERCQMALFLDGLLCPYCRAPMESGQELIGFTMVGSRDPMIREIDDSVVHARCLSRHPQRDQIVQRWNAEAEQGLGPVWMLAVGRDGSVRSFHWLDRLLYRLRIRGAISTGRS